MEEIKVVLTEDALSIDATYPIELSKGEDIIRLEKFMIELNQFFGEKNPIYRGVVELAQLALLGDNPQKRSIAIKALDDIFDNTLQGSFAGDNQLFLTVRDVRGNSEVMYICDLPQTYCGKKSVARGYRIRE